jgi:Ca2+-binding RTX toxin-like protein
MATFTTNLPSMDFYGDLTDLGLLLNKWNYTVKTDTTFTVTGPGNIHIYGFGSFDNSGDFPAGPITKLLVYVPTGPNAQGYYQIDEISYNFTNLLLAIQDGSFREALFLNNDTITGSTGGDKLYGYNGDDTINGQGGNDGLYGGIHADTLNGGDGDDTLHGGEHVDTLNGGDGDDTAYGEEGNDTLNGHVGNDKLFGGDGTDMAFGASGEDHVYGGADVDYLYGGNDRDYLYGGSDDDTLDGGDGNDSVHGDSGNDSMSGGTGNDSVTGGIGDDKMYGFAGDDFLMGETGKDTIDGGAGIDTVSFVDRGGGISVTLNGANDATVFVAGVAEDTIKNVENVLGSLGNDIITGDANANELHGFNGNDTFHGGDGDDQLQGGYGDDQLFGDGGNDTIIDDLGKDTIDGGAGIDTLSYADRTAAVSLALNGETNAAAAVAGAAEDTVRNVENILGGSGGDTLTGDAFANLLAGNGGNDALIGGKGGDALSGGAGDDRLVGGKGADTFTGGVGADQFVFDVKAKTKAADAVADFAVDEDTIVLDNAVFKALKGKVLKGGDYFHVGKKPAGNKDLVIYDENSGKLLYDADGKGDSKAKLIATLDSGLGLSDADFLVI